MSSMISRAACGACLNTAGSSSNPSASSSIRRSAACARPVRNRFAGRFIARDWISGRASSPGSVRSRRRSATRSTAGAMSNAGLNPRDIGALVALVEQNRPGEAEDRARALLATHPNAGMLWKILSVALLRQDKDALQALRRTVELLPQDAEAHGNLAAALRDRGQWAAALASWHRALTIRPHDVEALVDAADGPRELGMARDSVPLYRRALQIDPKLIPARNNLGNAFLELAQYADAAGCYRAALQIKPDDAQILCNLGNAQRLLGLLDEAMVSSRRAAALDPDSSVAHNIMGLIFAARRQREEAGARYRPGLRLKPRYVDVL